MNTRKNVQKALFSKVESESHKLELSIVDNLRKALETLDSSYKKSDKEVNEAYIPLRRIENLVRELDSLSNLMTNFKAFSDNVQQAESERDKALQKVKNAEQELGVSIPMPKELEQSYSVIREFQRREELLRGDLSGFDKAAKALSSAIKMIP